MRGYAQVLQHEMQFPNPTSRSWTEVVSLVLSGALGGTALSTWLKGKFLKRKTASESAKIDAETENTRLDGTIKANNYLVLCLDRLQSKLNLNEAAMDQNDREHAAATRFYRRQIEYYEALDVAYRNRSHAMNGEMQKLLLGLRGLESDYCEQTGKSLMPFPIKTFDEIIRPWPLPHPPE